MHNTRPLTRTQRTGIQAGTSALVLLVIKYFLGVFGVTTPEDVLIAMMTLFVIVAAKAQNFAEDQGWLKTRRV